MTNQRYSTTIPSIAIATSVASSDAISYGAFSSGMVYVPSGSSITTLTWHVCETKDGTYLPAENVGGTALTNTIGASLGQPIPTELAGAPFIKATGNAAGTIGVTLKD